MEAGWQKILDIFWKWIVLSDKKNQDAVRLGRLGGEARKKNLTPEQRSEIARKAAKARWEKYEQRKMEGNSDKDL